jgi:hypothetical protein
MWDSKNYTQLLPINYQHANTKISATRNNFRDEAPPHGVRSVGSIVFLPIYSSTPTCSLTRFLVVDLFFVFHDIPARCFIGREPFFFYF